SDRSIASRGTPLLPPASANLLKNHTLQGNPQAGWLVVAALMGPMLRFDASHGARKLPQTAGRHSLAHKRGRAKPCAGKAGELFCSSAASGGGADRDFAKSSGGETGGTNRGTRRFCFAGESGGCGAEPIRCCAA